MTADIAATIKAAGADAIFALFGGTWKDGLDERTITYIQPFIDRDPDMAQVMLSAARLRSQTRRVTKREPAYVYFVQAGEDGLVKIGCASDVASRLATLQTGSPEPLRLLGVTAGGKSAESALHRRFAHLRVRGEWFVAAEELLGYIQEQQ